MRQLHRVTAALLATLPLAACARPASTTSAASSETASTGSEAEAHAPFAVVSVADVHGRLGPSIAVFDANSRETFDAHHVPGATWVHYDSVTAAALPADPATPCVFYCANESCSASHVAAETAVSLGHTDVAVMSAGIEGWVEAGLPVESAPSAAD